MAQHSLQGKLIIAAPSLADPNFFHTVVLLVQHSSEGALGLVLNRPTDLTIREAWEQVNQDKPCNHESPLFQGGPCEGVLMVLHGAEEASELQVMPGVYFSTEQSHVEWLLEHGEEPIRFFVGYAGWGPGQLEQEMTEGSWLTAPIAPEQIFAPADDQWTALVQAIARAQVTAGIKPNLIPPDPSLN